MKKFLIGVVILIAALSITITFYVLQPVPIPENSEFSFDLEKIRARAQSQEGSPPLSINSLLICQGVLPRLLIVAGQGFKKYPLPVYAYQIVYPNTTIIVDTAIDHQTHSDNMPRSSTFYPKNYDTLQAALRKASLIGLTHEHLDHSAGLSQSPYLREIASRVVLTWEQLQSPHLERSGFTAEKKSLFTPLRYDTLHPLAPGVVLIKAPGHSPGSQMVYVKLEDGSEFLLVGDVAWSMDNITLPRAHPRVISWLLKEDTRAQVHQLRFLHHFHRDHPEVNLVVAHDGAQMDNYLQHGLIHGDFSPDP